MCFVPLEGPLNAMAACKNNSSVLSTPGAGTTFHGRRLIFFNVAESRTEPALLQLFSQHGEVADMFIVRSALGHSSGCGHVTFATAEQARAALKALKGSLDCAEPGTTLGVLLVEEGPSNSSSGTTDDAASTASLSPKAVGASNTAQSQHSAEGKCGKAVFFTKVPPTVTSQQLIQLFTACGEVAHLELFIPWPGAKISRGCGLVEFSCTRAAAAAVHSMHQQFTWPHSHSALVVEWVDRSRQSTNSKSNKPRAGAGGGSSSMGAAGSPAGSVTGTGTSLRADHLSQQAAAASLAWRPAHSGEMPQQAFARAGLLGLSQQQQPGVGRSSRSCPLPQLPPGWQVIGTATAQQLPPGVRAACPGIASQWASVPSSLSSYAGPTRQQQPVPAAAAAVSYLPQTSLQAGMPSSAGEGAALTLQQQQQLLLQQQQQRTGGCSSEAGSAGTWLACPATNALSNNSMGASVELNSITSIGSGYDAALLSSSAFSSNANSANNSAVLQCQLVSSWDKQPQPQQPTVLDLSGCDSKGALGGMVVAPQYSEPMIMSAATAAAMSGSHNDGILQQLLQQNVMLLQTMTPPPEEEAVAQHLLLPTSGAPAQQGMVGSMVASSTAAVGGGLGGGLPSYVPLSQVQQLPQGQMLYAGSSLPSPQQQQQRQQQLWWLQQAQVQQANHQQQQQQDMSTAVVALPLTDRQLGAMSGVLPEVARMTGAQAWISSAAGGGLQLCLSGSYPQLQAGHAAVAMLLGKAGVDEPLAAAMVHAAAN